MCPALDALLEWAGAAAGAFANWHVRRQRAMNLSSEKHIYSARLPASAVRLRRRASRSALSRKPIWPVEKNCTFRRR